MARVAGDSGEVKGMAGSLKRTLEDIIETNKKGKSLLGELAATSKDKSYNTAEDIVNEVAAILLAALPDCSEVAQKLVEYSVFLADLEQG